MSKLKLDLQSNSHLLGGIISAEVRDSQLNLVGRIGRGQELDVSPGLYQVNAVLEDGRRHSRLVQVTEDATPAVRFELSQSSLAEHLSNDVGGVSIRHLRQMESVQPMSSGSGSAGRRERLAGAESGAQLLRVEGADIEAAGPERWDVRGRSGQFAWAEFQLGSERLTLSLPTQSGHQQMPGPDSLIEATQRAEGYQLRALIHPQRTVASTLQHMLLQGHLQSALEVADQATDLLASKYEDPVGATLGALILQRVGRLERLESWLHNLAQRFDWLPDARVLQLALNAGRQSTPGLLDELIDLCAGQRPLFTESYSLLLDLLRRWPGNKERERRVDALAQLSDRYGGVDWGAITFTTRSQAC